MFFPIHYFSLLLMAVVLATSAHAQQLEEEVKSDPVPKVEKEVPKGSGEANSNKKSKIVEIKEKTSLLFSSESMDSKYSEYTGEWRSIQLPDDSWTVRLQSEKMQACRLDFGPFLNTYDLSISAKILSKSKGRLKPRYGVGLYGKYGFWLRLSGGSNQLELVQYGEVLTSVPYQWRSDKWIYLELRMKAQQGYWLLLGRAWLDGQVRPKEPNVTYKITKDQLTHSLKGRGNLSASPYNGLPIYFDKIELKKVQQWPSFKLVEEN